MSINNFDFNYKTKFLTCFNKLVEDHKYRISLSNKLLKFFDQNSLEKILNKMSKLFNI